MTMQCYFEYPADSEGKRKRCESVANEEFEYWCTGAHKREWQEENFKKPQPENGARYTIPEIQAKLRARAKEMRQKRDGLFAE